MNKYFFILFFSTVSFSQSLYNPTANKTVSYNTAEDFYITFERNMYGFEFKRNDRKLNPALQTKIERFMTTTNRQKFKGLGLFTLNIIMRNDKYYVVEQKKPEKLLDL